jgi:hypothetical protein
MVPAAQSVVPDWSIARTVVRRVQDVLLARHVVGPVL